MSGSGEVNTPFLGLIKPPVGADQDVWGTRWNTNADTLDTSASGHDSRIAALESAVAALQAQITPGDPAGVVKWWPGPGPFPASYLGCDGSWYATTEFPDLFAAIGYGWGGDGASSFAVPDLRGRALVGFDQGTGRLQGVYGADQIGQAGGTALVTLAGAHMPAHQHGGGTDMQGAHLHNFSAWIIYSSGWDVAGSAAHMLQQIAQQTDIQGAHDHAIVTDIQGGGQPHPNCQPAALGYWIIKAAPG